MVSENHHGIPPGDGAALCAIETIGAISISAALSASDVRRFMASSTPADFPSDHSNGIDQYWPVLWLGIGWVKSDYRQAILVGAHFAEGQVRFNPNSINNRFRPYRSVLAGRLLDPREARQV